MFAAPCWRARPWALIWSTALGAIAFAMTALTVLMGAAQPFDLWLIEGLRAPGLPGRLAGPPGLAGAALGLTPRPPPRSSVW